MGKVYLAHDDFLGRDVAFKVLREQYAEDEEFVERFEREARSVVALSHPPVTGEAVELCARAGFPSSRDGAVTMGGSPQHEKRAPGTELPTTGGPGLLLPATKAVLPGEVHPPMTYTTVKNVRRPKHYRRKPSDASVTGEIASMEAGVAREKGVWSTRSEPRSR